MSTTGFSGVSVKKLELHTGLPSKLGEKTVHSIGNGRMVSAPIRWNEVDDADPGDFTIATVPKRFAELGDLHAGIDDAVYALDELLEWAERDVRDDDGEIPELD